MLEISILDGHNLRGVRVPRKRSANKRFETHPQNSYPHCERNTVCQFLAALLKQDTKA